MQYLLQILWQNSSKIPVWSGVEEASTLLRTIQNYSELLLSSKFLQNYFLKKIHLHWKLIEQLLLLQSNILIFWKDIFQNSYYRRLLVKLATWSRCLWRLIFARLIFVEFVVLCNSVKICLRRFFSYSFIRRK